MAKSGTKSDAAVARTTIELDGFEVAGQILLSNPNYATPKSVISSIRTLFDEVSFPYGSTATSNS